MSDRAGPRQLPPTPSERPAWLDSAVKAERARIARELHDDLGSNLIGIKLALASLSKALADQGRTPAERGRQSEKAAYLDQLVDQTIDAMHRLTEDLRPDTFGRDLVEPLARHAAEFQKQSGIGCVFTTPDQPISLQPEQAHCLFRIAQEALGNIGKHSRASQVSLRLDSDQRQVCLAIADNGCGMRHTDHPGAGGFGLRGMQERAAALGGDCTAGALDEGGSVVTVRLPLQSCMTTDTSA